MLKFALKNMFVRRARVLLVILSIILSASVALLAFNISQQVNEGIISTAGYYDMIIGPAGSSTQLAMNTMFFTDEPLGTISYEYVEELKASPLTNAVVPFTMGDSFNGARIVGTTPEYLNGKTIKSGEMFSEPFEAVVGSAVAQRYGLTLGSAMVTSHGLTGTGHAHEANPLTVVGILSKTGTAYDNVVFTACETVWAVHDHSEETDAHEEDEHHGEEEHHEESAPETASDAAMGHFLPGSANAPKQDETGNQAQKTQDTEDKHEHHHGDVCAILVKSKSFNDYFKLMEIYGTNASLLCINPST
ncbi:MAG: ABC transporter permease, partial [Clostridia bacterium]|nr:ABC transporter permease [Clostridia bacterium]